MKVQSRSLTLGQLLGAATLVASATAGSVANVATDFPIFGPPGTKTPTMFKQFTPYLPTMNSGSVADDAVLYFPHISQTYGGGDWDWASGSKW